MLVRNYNNYLLVNQNNILQNQNYTQTHTHILLISLNLSSIQQHENIFNESNIFCRVYLCQLTVGSGFSFLRIILRQKQKQINVFCIAINAIRMIVIRHNSNQFVLSIPIVLNKKKITQK